MTYLTASLKDIVRLISGIENINLFTPLILLLLTTYNTSVAQKLRKQKEDTIFVKVFDHNAHHNDKLMLMYYTNTLYNVPSQTGDYKTIIASMGTDSIFRFKFSINKESGNFFLGRKIQKRDSVYNLSPSSIFLQISNLYLPEIGDDILIDITEFKHRYFGFSYNLKFSGNGSTKYNIQEKIRTFKSQVKPSEMFDRGYNYLSGNSNEMYSVERVKFLDEHKKEISRQSYEIIKADIMFHNPVVSPGMVEFYYINRVKNINPDTAKLYKERFKEEYNKRWINNSDYGFSQKTLLQSRFYIDYLLQKISKCDFIVNNIDKKLLYSYLKDHFTGELRDQLLTTYFLDGNLSGYIEPENINDAILTVKTPYCLQKLKFMDSGSAVKEKGNLVLLDSYGKLKSISNYKGKVVLVDFWFTGCGACKVYYSNELSFVEQYFKNDSSVVFLSVSIDRDLNTWKKSVNSEFYTSKTVTNLFTMGMGAQHPAIKYYKVLGFPTVLLLGKDGKILSYNEAILRKRNTTIEAISDALDK